MKTTPQLDAHARHARECFENADRLEDDRIKAGLELIAARKLVDAGETDVSWKEWCAHHIKRSDRDIRRVMALARADDPLQARENEKARNRAAKAAGSRAASPFRAHDEGVGAFLRGAAEDDCPYTDRQRHAAWRKGWSETKLRTDASPPVARTSEPQAARTSSTGLRQAIEKNWPLLSPSDQASLIDWLFEHMTNLQESALTQGHHPPKAAPLRGGKILANRSSARNAHNTAHANDNSSPEQLDLLDVPNDKPQSTRQRSGTKPLTSVSQPLPETSIGEVFFNNDELARHAARVQRNAASEPQKVTVTYYTHPKAQRHVVTAIQSKIHAGPHPNSKWFRKQSMI